MYRTFTFFLIIFMFFSCGDGNESNTTSQTTKELFISEYVEGGGGNKYIELYNPTSGTIALNSYSLKIYVNGSSTPTTELTLTGSIASQTTFVAAYFTADAWNGTTNISSQSQVMNYNGNDPIALFKNTTLLDIVGTPGSSDDFAKDVTLRRRPQYGPATQFNTNQWYKLAKDTVSGLGTHYYTSEDPTTSSSSSSSSQSTTFSTAPAGNLVFISEYHEGWGTDKYIEIFNSGSSTVDLSQYKLYRKNYDSSGNHEPSKDYILQLSGQLYSFYTYVVVNNGYTETTLDTLHALTSGITKENGANYPNLISVFSGNDVVYLIKTNAIVDCVGFPGVATNWGRDILMIRQPGEIANPSWNPSKWNKTVIYTSGTPDSSTDDNAGWHQYY